MTRLRRTSFAVPAALAVVGGLVIGAAPASATTVTVTGGTVKITVTKYEANAMSAAHITMTATGKATYTNRKLTLQITGGKAVNGPSFLHVGGGFRLTKGTHSVLINDFVMDSGNTNGGTVNAHIAGKEVTDAFALNNQYGGEGGASFDFQAVHFTKFGQQAADSKLSTSCFANHTNLGPAYFDETFKH